MCLLTCVELYNKSKQPQGKPEERPPAPPQDTSGVRSLDDCSGPADEAEAGARRERGDSWSEKENPFQWQTQGRGKGNEKAQDGKKNEYKNKKGYADSNKGRRKQ